MKLKYGPYSSSRFETATCPLRFSRVYIEKSVEDKDSRATRKGNAIHETFEMITKGWIDNKPLSKDVIFKIVSEKIKEYHVDPEDIKLCIDATICYLSNPPKDIEDIIGTEEHLSIKMVDGKYAQCDWEDPECLYRGKIDILKMKGTSAFIVDHKTQPHAETADTFQMGFYAWLVSKYYPYVTEIHTQLHLCNPFLNFYSKPYKWSLQELQDIELEIECRTKIAEGIDPEKADAVANFHCNYCPVVLECPKIASLSKLRTQYGNIKKAPLVDAQAAVEIASILTVVDEGRKVLNARLQDFVKNIGPVVIPGKEYTYKTSKKHTVKEGKLKELIDFLTESGIDPYKNGIVKIDMESLENLWRSTSAQFLEKIRNNYLDQEISTRFSGTKS